MAALGGTATAQSSRKAPTGWQVAESGFHFPGLHPTMPSLQAKSLLGGLPFSRHSPIQLREGVGSGPSVREGQCLLFPIQPLLIYPGNQCRAICNTPHPGLSLGCHESLLANPLLLCMLRGCHSPRKGLSAHGTGDRGAIGRSQWAHVCPD